MVPHLYSTFHPNPFRFGGVITEKNPSDFNIGFFQAYNKTQPKPTNRGVSLRTIVQRRRSNGIDMPPRGPLEENMT